VKNITPCLWFDGQAEEAVALYTSLLPDSEVTQVSRYGEAGPGTPGTVMVMGFRLLGQDFLAVNGGPDYQFTPAVSLMVNCENQDEIDRLWERLGEGGGYDGCGWLRDRFGVSWQIVPTAMGELLGDPDPEKSGRAMQAMLKMQKLDIQTLRDAHAGKLAGAET
jgi:predicted 3-demethylubiquinone-9 3-methyltransferase (glyoxalase superfamily)